MFKSMDNLFMRMSRPNFFYEMHKLLHDVEDEQVVWGCKLWSETCRPTPTESCITGTASHAQTSQALHHRHKHHKHCITGTNITSTASQAQTSQALHHRHKHPKHCTIYNLRRQLNEVVSSLVTRHVKTHCASKLVALLFYLIEDKAWSLIQHTQHIIMFPKYKQKYTF